MDAIALAVVFLALALVFELTSGFSLGEAEGSLAEFWMALALISASALTFGQMGRRRRLLAALYAFAATLVLWGFNASISTSLDANYGGAYAWSSTRVMVLALFVGPVVAVMAAILTFGFAQLRAFNPTTAQS